MNLLLQPHNINPQNLPYVPLKLVRHIIATPTIYFCLNGEEVVYIGMTTNIKRHWRGHPLSQKLQQYAYIKIAYKSIAPHLVHRTLEQEFINYWQPQLNEIHKTQLCLHDTQTLICINAIATKLLLAIAARCDTDNTIILSPRHKRIIYAETGISELTFHDCLFSLITSDLIRPLSTHEYMINPNCISAGCRNNLWDITPVS